MGVDPKTIDIENLPEMGYKDIFDISSGVYFIYTSDYKELLYVGQSRRKIRWRIMQHMGKLRELGFYVKSDDYKYARYKAIQVPIEDLDDVEEFFIRKFMPPLNSDKNPSEDRIAYNRWFAEKIWEYDAENGVA